MDFSNIKNYNELLVLDYIQSDVEPRYSEKSEDFFLDVACYALSKLPSRYMRHDIDMAFFMNEGERTALEIEVKTAVDDAVGHILKNP